MTRDTQELFTRDEAARELHVCIRSIDSYVHNGILKVVRRQRQGSSSAMDPKWVSAALLTSTSTVP